jgi:hypothetical protein
MTDLLLSINPSAFPLRTGRNAVKQQFHNLADSIVGIVQCGYECLMSPQVSLLVPFRMASKQEQWILISGRSGSFRFR